MASARHTEQIGVMSLQCCTVNSIGILETSRAEHRNARAKSKKVAPFALLKNSRCDPEPRKGVQGVLHAKADGLGRSHELVGSRFDCGVCVVTNLPSINSNLT
jgi:hypothetical protein